MALPAALAALLADKLNAKLSAVQPVSGGDISQAARVEAGGRAYLVKWHERPPQPPPGWLEMFEAELAMCRLFGGFPADFFAAYDAVWPPAPGRDERIPLYQLYHLLNHLNLFGEGYGGQVDSVLRRNA